MQLQQGFATGEMGFNDKFALQTILNGVRFGSWLFSNSGGTLAFAGDGCCGGWDFRSLWSPWKHVSHELKPLHRKFDLLEKHAIIEETG